MSETGPDIPGVTVRRRLAIGGMGELFLAEQRLPDGTVRAAVVKRLLGDDPAHVALFAREGDALAATRSDHVVGLLDRGPGWLLLEHVDGVDLGALLAHRARRGRPLPVGAALAVVRGLARGLVDLHEARDPAGRPLGLVHRDVGPGNVLLGRDGAVKLADLGVVRVGASDGPTVAGLKGTLAYMAPEQLDNAPTTAATDVYAAGLVAYEVLTGVPARPAGAIGITELVAARARLPASPDSLRPELPPALTAAVMRALAPAPSDRPPTARDWLEALEAAPGDEDVAALAKAVARAAPETDAARVAPARTLAPDAIVGAAAAPEVALATRRPRVAMFAVAGLAAVAVALAFVVPRAMEPTPPAAATSALATAAPGVLVADAGSTLARVDDGPDVVERADTDRAALGGPTLAGDAGATAISALTDPVAAAADTALAASPAEDAAGAPPPRPPVAATRRPPATRTRPDVVVAAAPASGRLAIEGAGVYISAPGAMGLDRQVTSAFGEDEPQVIRLTGGGPEPFQVIVRAVRRGDRVRISVGAPSGTWYRVDCGGEARATPIVGVVVPAGGLRCRVTTQDDRTLAFRLTETAS